MGIKFERRFVRVIAEILIPGISTIEIVKDHSPQRLACCALRANEKILGERLIRLVTFSQPFCRPSKMN